MPRTTTGIVQVNPQADHIADQKPFASILMPVRNEANFIERSLGAVLAQDYPHDRIQVLIADGMSDDGTRDRIVRLSEQSSISVTILDNPKHIVPTGMNIALKQAKGDIIVRVDGHCEIALDYITQCVNYLQDDDTLAGVGGPIETISQNPIGETIAVAMSSRFGVGDSAFRTLKTKTLLVDTIPFPAYKREAIDKAGPYDEELMRNQDDEYNYRLRSLGYKLLLTPNIRSKYYSRGSIKKLWRQYYQYGFYKVRVLQKHPRQMSLRQSVPPLFVFSLLVGAILSLYSQLFLALWLGLVLLYVTVNLTASLITAHNTGYKHLWRLPVIFATLHLSYGLGFLHGLIIFRHRWRV